ncbi:hypothetical protein SASPL_137449 [Salvia splendens]|uniref:Uncharacterized protein n=1 Tax=Salvia splendens TaxID=180675 RepID=A0A8X8WUZ1_SALSN|nr:hypothetical protein SASPL_137449 [Salvia splendens]
MATTSPLHKNAVYNAGLTVCTQYTKPFPSISRPRADAGTLRGEKAGLNVFTFSCARLISIVFEINEPYPDVVAWLGFAAYEAEDIGAGAGAPDVVDLDVADLDKGGVDEVEVGDGALLHGYPSYVLLLHVIPQTADADAMAWPALHVLDEDVAEFVPKRDAVVSRLDDGIENTDVVSSGYVDAIGVRAFIRGGDSEALEGDVAAGDAVDVEVFAVLGGDVLDDGVVDEVQAQVDGELRAVLVFVTIVQFPGFPTLPVEHAPARDGKEVYVVNGYPFLGLHREFPRVLVGFQVAFHHKGDRGLAGPRHAGLAQYPIPFWDQDLACRW